MKKTMIAVAVIATAGPAHALSLLNTQYGSMDMTGRAYAGHYFGDDRDSEMYGSNSFLRFGLKGRSKINDTLTAIGTYEGQLNLTSSPTFALCVSGGGFPLLGDSCSRSTWFLLHRAA